jgi:general secretion pathway protein G
MRQLHTRRTRSDAGWTLIELLVVLSLIMVLASLAMSQYRNSVRTAEEAALKSNLMRMRDAIDQYYADKGQYPSSLQTLVSEGYLRAVPLDTITKSQDSWVTVPAEPDPARPTADAGIYDIKSGSDGTALNGTRYSDWD